MGVAIPTPIQVLLRQKVPDPNVYRDLALEGLRVSGKHALDAGLVDALGGMEECLGLVQSRNLLGKAAPGAWGRLKEDMYSETLAAMNDYEGGVRWRVGIEKAKEKYKEKALGEVEAWEKAHSKAKL